MDESAILAKICAYNSSKALRFASFDFRVDVKLSPKQLPIQIVRQAYLLLHSYFQTPARWQIGNM